MNKANKEHYNYYIYQTELTPQCVLVVILKLKRTARVTLRQKPTSMMPEVAVVAVPMDMTNPLLAKRLSTSMIETLL